MLEQLIQQVSSDTAGFPTPHFSEGVVGNPAESMELQGYCTALSADGSILVVGAPDRASSRGAVFIFKYAAGVWTQQAYILCPATGVCRFGSSLGMSADGIFLLIGAHDYLSGKGRVYQYTRIGSSWVLSSTRDSPVAPTVADHFGFSIAVSDTWVAIGAHGRSTDTGGVFLYERTSATVLAYRTHIKSIPAETVAGEKFGYGVALDPSGTTLVVTCGAIDVTYFYTRSGVTWTKIHRFATGYVGNGMHGKVCAIASDNISAIVASPFANVGGTPGAGLVIVYTNHSGVWQQVSAITEPIPESNNFFGFGAAITNQGKQVLVGAYGAGAQQNTGAVYAYSLNSGQGTLDLTFPSAEFSGGGCAGMSVAVSSDNKVVAVGGQYWNWTGKTYIFRT